MQASALSSHCSEVGSPQCITHRVSQGAAESPPVPEEQFSPIQKECFFHVNVVWSTVGLLLMMPQEGVSVSVVQFLP